MKAKNTFTTILSVLLTVVIIVLSTAYAIPTAYATENTWDPSNGVYNISTEADLIAFRDALNSFERFYGIEVNLLNDITFINTYEAPCSNGDSLVYFSGTFNGNNHTISNLNIVSSDYSTASFFPILNNATIKDLTLKDLTLQSGLTWNAAFVSLSMGNDKIINCRLTGNCIIKTSNSLSTSYSTYCGGFVASNYSGSLTIENCSVGDADSNILINATGAGVSQGGNRFSGGVLGFGRKGTDVEIISTDNYADVRSDGYAGGIIGLLNSSDSNYVIHAKITDCRNYGKISSNETSIVCYCGGILGYSTPYAIFVIDRCINHGDVTAYTDSGLTDTGGIVGSMNCGTILNTYNTGTIEAISQTNLLGGLVGHIRVDKGFELFDTDFFDYYPDDCFNAIINCYNVGDVIGHNTNYTGGICGYVQDIYTLAGQSIIKNAYNFATVSGTGKVGSISACLQDTTVTHSYGQSGSYGINGISIHEDNTGGVEGNISEIGYYDTPEATGTIYPATVRAETDDGNENFTETLSSTPLTDNLLDTLNQWVSDKNSALEAGGNDYRYLTWKMTNPASEDGSKGVTVHPMFGVLEEQGLRFHVNKPGNGKTDRLFRVYDGDASEAEDTTAYTLTNGKVDDFYAVPAFAGDNYVFAGWYYNQFDGTADGNTAFDFSSAVPEGVTDVYAHWIAVGTVNKDSEDSNLISGDYRGFGLAGVQIRDPELFDSNYNKDYNNENDRTPGGMRFVTSLSESLLSSIDALSSNKVNTTGGNVDVEYGYVVGTEKTIAEYIDGVGNNWTTPVIGHYKGVDLAKYRLLYKGENVNGVNTAGATQTADTDFRYITNVNCTRGTTNSMGTIKEDHHSFTNYRLYSLVVTYEGESESKKGENVDARAYIRYYDANGKLRVFYNDYRNASNVTYYGGCMCSFEQVSSMAIPQDPTLLEQQQQITG